MKFLFRFAHLVTAVSAINVGLSPHGYNVCANQTFVGTCGEYMTYGSYFIGACGVLGVLHFLYKMSTCSQCANGGCNGSK